MDTVKNLFYGALVGVANIIPGVSGGTMALVLGFYERLIGAIHNISGESLFAFFALFRFNRSGFERFKGELKRIDAGFLAAITLGALAAIVALASLMTFLLKEWHDPTYGFFFGLVLVSAVVPYRIIKKKSVPVILSFLVALAGVFSVSISISDADIIEKARVKHELKVSRGDKAPGETGTLKIDHSPRRLVFLLMMGAVTISAMILPGVSGAFLLLLMGGYFDILKAISGRDFIVLGVFSAGCLAGIILFSRLLNYMLERWSDETMGGLFGLVIGSLWMIWPFRKTLLIGSETVYLSNTFPAGFGMNEIVTLAAFIGGMAVVFLLLKLDPGEKNEEIPL